MKYFGWIFLFFIALYIIPLNNRPMLLDELRYAESVREMVANGEYAAVTVAGKADASLPPMFNWLSSAWVNVFGQNNFAMRLCSALAAGLTALLTALLIQQNLRDEKLAALAATLTLSCVGVVVCGTLAIPDMLFAMSVTGTLGTLFLALQEPEFNRRKFSLSLLAGLFSALAILTEGLSGLLFPLLVVIPYIFFSRKFKDCITVLPLFILFAAIPSGAWAMQLLIAPPEMLMEFLLTAGLFAGDYRWYSYAPVLIAGAFPILILLPAALMTGRESWKRLLNQPLCQFSLCTLVLLLIWFSAWRSFPPSIILMLYPPVAILTAMGLQAYFNNGGHHRSFDWMLNIWGLFLLITGCIELLWWFLKDNCFTEYFQLLPFTRLFLLNLGISSVIGGGVLLYSLHGNWRSRLYLFFFSIAILPLGISWCIKPQRFMPEATFRTFIREFDIIPEKCEFFTSGEFVPALSWCVNKEVQTVDCLCPVIETADSGRTVYIILGKSDRRLKNIDAKRSLTRGEFTCIEVAVPEKQ